ncbi:F-box/LRR-repeat protein 3-like [Aphidius gifuensis]|uniref:F-box/LRR-repeat protein 3-like n=1 Tax=Aphidius gifuensis TaxID=684658 RepID=UPI001CDC946D|nr:F-box/LRR-repeat protein 3-like [Aphidius gifuensis]
MPDLANTIVKYCKGLKHLRIHYPHRIMDDTALKKLTELKNLECLILDCLDELHDESITAISNNCKKLKRLEIPYCCIRRSINDELLCSPSTLDELSKLQYLEHLDLNDVGNLYDSTIIAIANNCKNLKSLDIRSCTGITETGLNALTNLENLQKLNVSHLDITTDSFLIKLKGLKELHCDECKEITDAGIIQFIKNSPDLEKISVRLINNITNVMVIGANQATEIRTNEKFKNLQKLTLRGLCLDKLILQEISEATTLVHLNIELHKKHIEFPLFDKLVNLEYIEIEFTKLENLESLEINDECLSEKAIIAISNNCKKLKRLKLVGIVVSTGIDNDDELSSPSVLKDLDICSISDDITETALVALTNLENLEKLNVSYLDKITDSFIIKLKGLKELICEGCKKLTDVGIIQFIKNNPDLAEIYAVGIDNITVDLVIAADQATKNRTNGIILRLRISNKSIIEASKSIIKSQWLAVTS